MRKLKRLWLYIADKFRDNRQDEPDVVLFGGVVFGREKVIEPFNWQLLPNDYQLDN